jgi:beta-glucosidase
LVTSDNPDTDQHWQETSLDTQPIHKHPLANDQRMRQKALRDEAIRLAKESDQVLYFGGLNHDFDVEAKDRENIELPYQQDELISELLDVKPDTVIHLLSGSALDLSMWAQKAKVILWSSYLGMEGGNALVSTIYGDVSPSGKLTQTFARKLTDYSSHSIGMFPGDAQVEYTEEADVGYRHFEKQRITPAFCFGHGLSYATFEYDHFTIEKSESGWKVQLSIRNTSGILAKEIVQMYTQKANQHASPILAGFQKVTLRPLETFRVESIIDEAAFQEYDTQTHAMRTISGAYHILVGSSLKRIHHTFHIDI